MPIGDCGFTSAKYMAFPINVVNEGTWAVAEATLKKKRVSTFADRVYHVWWVDSPEDGLRLAKHLEGVMVPVGFDFETVGWSPTVKLKGVTSKKAKVTKGTSPCHPAWKPTPVTFQLSWGLASYVVAGNLLPLFADWLTNRAILDGANIGYELHTMWANGYGTVRFNRDVLSMHAYYNELSHAKAPGLKATGKLFLGIDTIDYDEVVPGHKKGETFADALKTRFEFACNYAAQDAFLTTLAADILEERLRGMPLDSTSGRTVNDIYREWNIGFQGECIRMEAAGFPIDKVEIKKQYLEVEDKALAVQVKANGLAGRAINLNSAQQLGVVYYKEQGRPVLLTSDSHFCLLCNKPVTKKTGHTCPIHGKGALVNNPAVSKPALEGWAKSGDALAKTIMEYRALRKLQATWLDGFWKYAQDQTYGYPSINSTGTVSGRLAAGIWITSPGSVRSALGYAPDADTDECLIGADFSQLELRVLGHVTGDAVICNAFNKKLDLHSYSAALIEVFTEHGFEATKDEATVIKVYERIHASHEAGEVAGKGGPALTKEQEADVLARKRTKKVNFGLIYGMGEAKLAADLGIPSKDAGELMSLIWMIYAGAREYFDKVLVETTERGYLQTINGRWQRLPQLQSEKQGEREYGKRLSMNKPCQCGAADLVTAAMIQVGIDLEAGGAYGTVGRMLYGSWKLGSYGLDNQACTPWAHSDMPPTLMAELGLLGKLGFKMILQCHDELLLRGPKVHAEQAAARLKALMEDPLATVLSFKVPLKVGVGYGPNWAAIK